METTDFLPSTLVTLNTFASYPFFHKELALVDATQSEIAPILPHSTPDGFLVTDDEQEGAEQEVKEAKESYFIEGRAFEGGLTEVRVMERWEAFYRFRVWPIIQDYLVFKRVVMEEPVNQWDDELASCLRLGIHLVSQELIDSLDEEEPKILDWTIDLRSFTSDPDEGGGKVGPVTSIGCPLARPHVEGQKPSAHAGKQIKSFVGQLVLSDFADCLTLRGILPPRGTLSLYFDEPNSVIYEPDLDIETNCDLIYPKGGVGAPRLNIYGFVETLVVDYYTDAGGKLVTSLYDIGSKFEEQRRVGKIPIEKFHLIGGQTNDYQGNNQCESADDFLILQTDIDQGYMIQMFFIGQLADIRKLDFSNIQCGNSLSR